MSVDIIQQLIVSVGFPIVCVIGLSWFIYKAYERLTEQNDKREEKLYTIITESQDTNKQLLQTNSEFVTVLNAYKSDLEEIKSDVSEIKSNMKG